MPVYHSANERYLPAASFDYSPQMHTPTPYSRHLPSLRNHAAYGGQDQYVI
jgi:hypothetical protein